MDIQDMRYVPDTVTVPRGSQLVIHLKNSDTKQHDLKLGSGYLYLRGARHEREEGDQGAEGGQAEDDPRPRPAGDEPAGERRVEHGKARPAGPAAPNRAGGAAGSAP